MKGGDNMKKEYSSLNNNFSKNYETIKIITSQKLMTGRPLTKKEKLVLKSCKEAETILQHKQELLEDKFSNFKMLLFYLVLPLKFLLVFITILFALFFTITKTTLLYNQLEKSVCGKDCGFIPNKNIFTISIQTLLFTSSKFLRIICCFLMLIYFISATITSMKKLGMINILPGCKSYTLSEVRSNKIISLVFYTMFLIFSIVSILEIFSVIPDLSFFNDSFTDCDIYNLGADHCNISVFGIFYLKFYVNLTIFKYFDMFFSASLICLISSLIVYFPVKSILNYWNSSKEESIA
jgi:hypothetical protein